jgi:addiction module RelE/StbE family toxin
MRARKQLEFSADAILDIADIEAYIAEHNEAAADKVATTIFRCATRLEFNPELGRPGNIDGTRELVLPKYPYTLIYKLTAHKIIVLNVLHQSQQYP